MKQLYLTGFALVGTLTATSWFWRCRQVNLMPILAKIIAAGIVTGRLGFIVTHLDVYAGAPLDVLDLRDGGVSATVAMFAMLGIAVEGTRRSPHLRAPLHIALAGGVAGWILAAILLPYAAKAPPQAPAIVVHDLDGDAVDLASFRGKPLVINLWASWCPPCRREMPLLDEAQRKHADVQFIFINQGEELTEIRRYLQSQRLSLRNVFSDRLRRISSATNSPGMPTTLFFDRQGELAVRHVGEIDAKSLEAALAQFGPGPAPSHRTAPED